MSNMDKMGILGLLTSVIFLVGLLVTAYPPPFAATVHTDGGVQVVTSEHNTLPEGTIIHKDFGKFWLCVEINGNFILMRNSGPSSLAVSVDSCNVE